MVNMIYDLAIVEDRGTYYRVVNIVSNAIDNQANINEKIIRLSYSAAEMMKAAIKEGKIVHIPKGLQSVEVQPFEFEIIDLAVEDDIQFHRSAILAKIRQLVTPEISKIAGLTMYGFIVLNNDLSSHGYFITNDNREELYLKILETGDEKLIEKLESYLNYKDEIERVAAFERKFSKFKQEVTQATTLEELKDLEEKFLENFYSNY